MAYNELIKNFNKIRDYMREFYVYGFKVRDEYTLKSSRSYDNEKRRMESILGEYMKFNVTPEGKIVFISIDSRITRHNPLFNAFKAKSFTSGDITLHFILLDILLSSKDGIELKCIVNKVYEKIPTSEKSYDESTIRKKLKEYIEEGIVLAKKNGKNVIYFLSSIYSVDNYIDIINLFSEISSCGVVGSFLLDKTEINNSPFAFKHHYITSTIDSEIIYEILDSISQKKRVSIDVLNRGKDKIQKRDIIPLCLMKSVQNGRQYVMSYDIDSKRIKSFRIDNIVNAVKGEVDDRFEFYRNKLDEIKTHIWGVSTETRSKQRLEHVDFTIKYSKDEMFIKNRLEREKRYGLVEHLDENTSKFSIDVFDSSELIPWIRTFICRIVDINFSNTELGEKFKTDLNEMYSMYGIEGGKI